MPLPKPKRPPEDDEPVDLALLMSEEGMGGDELEEDDYDDAELAEAEDAPPAAGGVDPELMTEFEAFDDPNADPSTRAAALASFVRLASSKGL